MSESVDSKLLKFQTTLQTIACAVLIAAVPWAYSMHGRVTSIEQNLKNVDRLEKRMEKIEDDIAWFRAFSSATKKKR